MAEASTLIKNSVDQQPAVTPSLTLKREAYFPTMIYSLDLPDPQKIRELNSSILRHVYAWRDADPEGLNRSNAKIAGSWHSPCFTWVRGRNRNDGGNREQHRQHPFE